MRVLQVSATNGFAEDEQNNSTNTTTTTTSSSSSKNNLILSTDLSILSTESTFGNNNENDRTHPSPNSNLENFTDNSFIRTNNTTTSNSNNSNFEQELTPNTSSVSLSSSSTSSSPFHQNKSHNNCKSSSIAISTTKSTPITTTNSTTTTATKTFSLLEQFNSDGVLIDSANNSTTPTTLEEHQNQNNSITETSATNATTIAAAPLEGVVDSLQNIDSSNYSFFEDCVNELANLESYRRTSAHNSETTLNGHKIEKSKATIQKEENQSLQSGQSTPSFEEIHLDNFALERELNRIIRGTSISEACEDDNSCNCKSLQESLRSYDIIQADSSSSRCLVKNDDNVSLNGDDDDYDDDQMDAHHNAGPITRSSNELCAEEDDDSLMDDDDDDEEYLSSQPSSCTSVSTPQRSHFPRGIINPNYPGFQHLAHTLSEHYISHQSSDPYDSDLSEYEMELSVDSFECDYLDGGSSSTGSNINHNNNNNLNTVMVVNNNLIDSKSIVAMDDTEDNFNGENGLTVLPLISVTQSFSDTNRNTATSATTATEDKESNSLQTYLKLYDSTTQQQENDERSKNLEIEIPQDDGNYGCPTPDILIKNYDSERYCRRVKPENRPDLLRNVSPNPPMKCRFEAAFMEDDDKMQQFHQKSSERDSPPNTLCTSENKGDVGRDDISLGLTPVDIVGDFGEEVEREFGLIVSGYNSRMDFDSYTSGRPFYLYNVAEAEKMSDALLSNGTEEIPISKYTTDVVDLVDLHNAHQRLSTEQATCTPKQDRMETPEEDEDHRVSEDSGHISENSINSRLTTQEATCDQNRGESNALEDNKIIPTAIVKPKYQKSSYDERQLPPVGLDFNVKSRAWFDSSSSNTRSTKKSQNDRNSKIYKPSKFSRGNSNNSSSTVSTSSSGNRFGFRRSSGNNNKGKIAVVQPMVKDPEERQMDNEKIDEQLPGVDNKPIEPHCTRYSFASWAASLRDSKRSNQKNCNNAGGAEPSACFDVYNIETALPEIDLEAIETHLKRANEEERRRRNDREEIRRRLAMGAEDDYLSKLVSNNLRPGRKPSLQSRLKNGKNLQICFTNEASSDTESHSSDSETCPKLSRISVARNPRADNTTKFFSAIDVPDHPYNANPLSISCTNNNPKKSTTKTANVPQNDEADKECDFFTRQARLQIEARMALSQAKDMAHMQMELDRQKQRLSPITGIIRGSLEKVGVIMAPEKRRVSRQMLTDMNIAQLQIIVNELHTQIEDLNDSLVHYLMDRDELHMSQDSMLVDIEDISRFLSAKELEDDG